MFTKKSLIHLAALIFVSLWSVAGVTARATTATIVAGRAFTLSATVAGTAPFTYQWSKDGVSMGGATASSYQVTNTQATNAGVYTVLISNSAGATTSDNATITLAKVPVISAQPVSQTVTSGNSAAFVVAASGLPTPTFQWKLAGAAIAGATNATLNIANAQAANAGTYTVVVANSAGSVISSGAILTVNSVTVAPVFTTQPVNQTVIAGSSATFASIASGSPAPAYQWRKNGVNITGATSSSYAIPSATSADASTYTVVASNSAGSATSNGAILTVYIAPVITAQPVSQTVTAGNSVTLTTAASGLPAPAFQWKLNGANVSGATNSTLTITNVQSANAGTYSVVASNSAGSVTSSGAILTVNSVASVPVFTTQPVGQTVTAGSAVTFTSSASGSPGPTYQWQKNGVNISGATGTSYMVKSATSTDAGTYTVVATNSAGSVTSNSAVLTISSAPVITTQPVNQTVTTGSSVTFTVVATGSPTLAYQWRKNGTRISRATSSSYTITNASSGNAGTYTVTVTNTNGSTTSAGATLTVTAAASAPVFTTQPVSQTAIPGSIVTFTALANGSPTPGYQWRRNGVNISGATGSSYTIASATSADAGTYSVLAANSAGSATSSGAVLSVSTQPSITTQPVGQTVTVGSSVTFAVAAGGSPVPTFQWKRNGTNLSGATNATLTIANVQTVNAGTYTVVASNSGGSVTSTGAILTVNAAATAPLFTTQPVSQVVTAGSTVTFTSLAGGSPTPGYQWRKNGVNISGATNSSYVIGGATSADAGTYTAVATNSAGSVTSNSAVLTINAAPVITTQPSNQSVPAGTSVAFTVVANGAPIPTYQWSKNGVVIPGATGAMYTIASAANGDAGSYSVVARNSIGSATSNGAVLTIRVPASPVVYRIDFNGDGKCDILWQNLTNGDCRVGLMTGTTSSSQISLGLQPLEMRNCGGGDFNKDGKSDILWQNSRTGECSVWLLSGTTVTAKVVLGTVPLEWQIRGAGDFNSDGKSDVVFQNITTGECSICLMDGTSSTSLVSLGQISTSLVITGTGDFNQDGQSDILWQDTVSGAYGVWLMAGTTVGRSVTLGTQTLDWQMSGAGDFNGDTQSDILWQNLLTGECRVWLMNGTTVSTNVIIGTVPLDWVLRN